MTKNRIFRLFTNSSELNKERKILPKVEDSNKSVLTYHSHFFVAWWKK